MKLNTLKPGRAWRDGRVKWCGPTALALITGRTLIHCQRTLAKFEGKDQRYLRGVSNSSMLAALRSWGYHVEPVKIPWSRHHPTLRQYIEEQMPTLQWRQVMLWNVTDHYVVSLSGEVCDNHATKPTPVAKHRWSRKRIVHGWIVNTRKVH